MLVFPIRFTARFVRSPVVYDLTLSEVFSLNLEVVYCFLVERMRVAVTTVVRSELVKPVLVRVLLAAHEHLNGSRIINFCYTWKNLMSRS
jgi:hypothetical protein